MTGSVLVAGIGNVFLGDDGFGVEVAARLSRDPAPDGVRIADYGIRGVHLAYELLDGYGALVLVDAMPMGEPPGTLAVLRPDALGETAGEAPSPVDSHTMHPAAVLAVLSRLGGSIDEVYVVGCEPASVEPGMSLSEPVSAAINPACSLVRELLGDLGAR